MLKISYIIFFGVLNILIFILLNKNVKMKRTIKIFLISIVAIFLIYHFFMSNGGFLTNDYFVNLLFFSIYIIILHLGLSIILPRFVKSIQDIKHSKFAEKYLVGFLIFFKNYLIYIMIYLYQVLELISY